MHLVSIGGAAVGEVKAETLIGQGNPVVGSVEPILSRKVVEAVPDLHPNAISRICASIETESSPSKLDVSLARSNDPVLSRGTITVENLNRSPVLKDGAANIKTLIGVPVGVEKER